MRRIESLKQSDGAPATNSDLGALCERDESDLLTRCFAVMVDLIIAGYTAWCSWLIFQMLTGTPQ